MFIQVPDPPVKARADEGAGASPSIRIVPMTREAPAISDADREHVIELRDVSCFYGSFRAVRNVDMAASFLTAGAYASRRATASDSARPHLYSAAHARNGARRGAP